MKAGSKVLGLTLGQKSIQVAEVTSKGDRFVVSNFGEFMFPEGVSLAATEKMGSALGDFLKSKRFTARDAVFGLPAKRLVTRRKDVPAVAPALAASTLRLQAEGEFSSELENLVMDFAGSPSAAGPSSVLLVATNKVVLDECEAIGKAAGLRVQGITSTGAALGRVTSKLPGVGDGLILSLGSNSAELIMQSGKDASNLRHLNVSGETPEAIGALAGEIRRVVAGIPKSASSMKMALWNTNGGQGAQGVLEQRLSMPVTVPDIRSLAATDAPGAEAYVSAIAVALTALEPTGLPIDFLNSRLAPPKPPAVSNAKKVAIAAGLLIAIMAGFGIFKVNEKTTELNDIQAKIKQREPALTQARADTKRLTDAENWIPDGPHFVAVLRDLTQLFPTRANTMWTTRLNNLPDGWELEGLETTDSYSSALVNAMLADKRFAKPVQTYIALEQTSGFYSFKIKFGYKGAE